MKVDWYGHACFLFEGQGVHLVTDPPVEDVGYKLPEIGIDLATVSHGHSDHNNANALHGAPDVINTTGVHDVKGLRIEGFPSFHDENGGTQRGNNLIFVWEMDGVRVCHLGDLGHALDDKTLHAIGHIDLLLVPVGGFYTIDASGAKQVVDQINPRLVIPMHYKTPALSPSNPIATADDFLKYYPPAKVRREQMLQVDGANLPSSLEIVVLDYVKSRD